VTQIPTTQIPATGSTRDVGVDLQENDENRAVIQAIESDNPGCGVRHMPGLVRITRQGRLVITRESVEAQLGREWEPAAGPASPGTTRWPMPRRRHASWSSTSAACRAGSAATVGCSRGSPRVTGSG
jgi:hypothetical protein